MFVFTEKSRSDKTFESIGRWLFLVGMTLTSCLVYSVSSFIFVFLEWESWKGFILGWQLFIAMVCVFGLVSLHVAGRRIYSIWLSLDESDDEGAA